MTHPSFGSAGDVAVIGGSPAGAAAALGIAPALRRERHGFLIPVMTRVAPLDKDRILLTGDAAGIADPLAGEGISATTS